jgi:hypothetical protein
MYVIARALDHKARSEEKKEKQFAALALKTTTAARNVRLGEVSVPENRPALPEQARDKSVSPSP